MCGFGSYIYRSRVNSKVHRALTVMIRHGALRPDALTLEASADTQTSDEAKHSNKSYSHDGRPSIFSNLVGANNLQAPVVGVGDVGL